MTGGRGLPYKEEVRGNALFAAHDPSLMSIGILDIVVAVGNLNDDAVVQGEGHGLPRLGLTLIGGFVYVLSYKKHGFSLHRQADHQFKAAVVRRCLQGAAIALCDLPHAHEAKAVGAFVCLGGG